MKLRSIFVAAVVFSLWISGLPAQVTPPMTGAGRPVLWSIHFDAERLRAGAGKNLFASLDPMLNSLTSDNSPVGAKLESIAILGFQAPRNSGQGFPLLVDLRFSPDAGGIAPRFEAISKKRGVPIEAVSGYPTMHFQHEGRDVWLAKYSDGRLVLSSTRDLLEMALKAGADALAIAPSESPDEILGGNVEIEPLLAANPAVSDSELLKLLVLASNLLHRPLVLMALAGWSILVKYAVDTPLLHLFLQPGPLLPLVLGAGLLIPLLSWAILLEWRGLRIACLAAFVFWIVPVMVAIVGVLSGTNPFHWPRWWLAASGFALPFFSISQSMSGLAIVGATLQTLHTPWLISLAAHALLAVVMFGCLRRAQKLSAK